jgi:hypothetical protein
VGPVRGLSGAGSYCRGDTVYATAAKPALDLRVTRNRQLILVALRLITSQLLRMLLNAGRLQGCGGERGGCQTGRGPGWFPVVACPGWIHRILSGPQVMDPLLHLQFHVKPTNSAAP